MGLNAGEEPRKGYDKASEVFAREVYPAIRSLGDPKPAHAA